MAARLVSVPRPAFRVWRELGDGACLGLPVRAGNLTAAYLLTREAASALLAASSRFSCPVDDFMNLTYLHGVDVMHLEPELVLHDAAVSGMGARTKPVVGAWARMRREMLRAARSLRLALSRLGARRRLGLLLRRAEPPRAPLSLARR